MSQETLDNVTEEVRQDLSEPGQPEPGQPELEQPESGQPESEQPDQEQTELVKEQSVKAKKQGEREENLKALRESRNQLQKERDSYRTRLQEIENAQKLQAQKATQEAEDFNFDDTDLDDNSSTKKELQQVKQYLSEMSANNSRMRLQTQYPDFNKIVNEESISILKQRFPEIASTLDQSKDIYTTGVSAYNIIKKFELHLNEDYEQSKQKIEANVNKPRPVSSLKTGSALGYASDYSDLESKEVRDEIIRIASERARNG